MKGLPSPDDLSKKITKLMIFDDIRAKEPVIDDYFGRGITNKCNLMFIKRYFFFKVKRGKKSTVLACILKCSVSNNIKKISEEF